MEDVKFVHIRLHGDLRDRLTANIKAKGWDNPTQFLRTLAQNEELVPKYPLAG